MFFLYYIHHFHNKAEKSLTKNHFLIRVDSHFLKTCCWYRAAECFAFGQKSREGELAFSIKINTLNFF